MCRVPPFNWTPIDSPHPSSLTSPLLQPNPRRVPPSSTLHASYRATRLDPSYPFPFEALEPTSAAIATQTTVRLPPAPSVEKPVLYRAALTILIRQITTTNFPTCSGLRYQTRALKPPLDLRHESAFTLTQTRHQLSFEF